LTQLPEVASTSGLAVRVMLSSGDEQGRAEQCYVQTHSCTVLYLVRTLHGWLNDKLARFRVADSPSFTVALWKLIRERGWTNLCPWQGTSVPSNTAKDSCRAHNGAIFRATRGQILIKTITDEVHLLLHNYIFTIYVTYKCSCTQFVAAIYIV